MRRPDRPRRDIGLGIALALTVCGVALPLAYWLFVRDEQVPTYGPSMFPTLRGEQSLDVDFDAYDDELPRRGDIVTLQGPIETDTGFCPGGIDTGAACATPSHDYSDTYLIKRVVGLPGDRLAISYDGRAVVNGERLAEPYVHRCRRIDRCALPRTITVPKGHFFVLGDNRRNSTDSREWGPVEAAAIDGRVLLEN